MKSRLVPLVVSVAQEGVETAGRILDEAARNLASIVKAVLDNIGELPVYPTRGIPRADHARGSGRPCRAHGLARWSQTP